MNALNIITSVAVAFILLRASFCAAREERSARTARRQGIKYPYLALVDCGKKDGEKCAGSIVSPSKVLSYCACADAATTKVYAGLANAAELNGPKVQQRTVTLVAKPPSSEFIKIFSVDEWNLTEDVKTVKLHFSKKGEKPTGNCKLVGFKDGAAAQELEQPIGNCTVCGIEDKDVFCTTAADDITKQSTKEVTLGDYPYLALVDCGGGAGQKCAASILSDSKVLSYCACADAAATTVYAGLIKTSDEQNAVKRTVLLVDQHPNKTELKIFTVENWEFTKNVSAVNFNEESKTPPTVPCKLVGFGAAGGAARALEQSIGDCSACSITGPDVYCTTATAATELLTDLDVGGPAVCDDMQYGVIHMNGKQQGNDKFCNAFIDISKHSPWIRSTIEGSSTGNNGTNGNGTTGVSSADSIYHQFKKHSKWRVGLMILLTAKLFLQ